MFSKSSRTLIAGVNVIVAALFLAGCGGIENGGEVSDNTLLDENRPPVAFEQHLIIDSSGDTNVTVEGAIPIMLRARDDDGDPLTYTIIQKPSHGILLGEPPNLQFLPDIGFTGTVYLVFRVNDGKEDSRTATVTIEIKTPRTQTTDQTAHSPTAVDDNVSTDEDTNVTIDVLGNDRDSDGTLNAASLLIAAEPSHGTAVIIDGTVVYSPEADYHGTDTFTYTVEDNEGLRSNEADVYIGINSINDLPVAYDDNITTEEGVTVSLQPLLNDMDPDGNDTKLHIVSITQPHYGIAIFEGNFVYYTPQSDSATKDTLTYTIEDEDGGRATATITINIALRNDAPVAFGQTIETNEDQAISFELNGTDPDGDTITYTLVYTQYTPQNGTISGDVPYLTYRPQRDFVGEDYIVFTVNDGNLTSNIATVTIKVLPVNDPPVAIAGKDMSGVRGDSFLLDGSQSYDVDGNIVSYEWKEGNVTLSMQEQFTHIFYEEGVHTITLTVTDDHNATDSDEKIITIDPCCEGCIYPDPTETNPFN